MKQVGLFDIGTGRHPRKTAPYAPDSDTSEQAAAEIKPHISRLQRIVLKAIAAAPLGLTCQEAEKQTKLEHPTVSARICELHQKRLVFDSGARRLTRSGRNATVWKAV
jgi:hypothetical protein